MYIIIVGGGNVGYHLSKYLLSEGHEVLVLEKDAVNCARFEDDLGSICVRGDGCEVATLVEAGASRADVFIAITNEDEDNLVACQIAKFKFNVPRTIARVNDPKNEMIFQKLGVDSTISVSGLIFQTIEEKLPAHPLVHLLTHAASGIEIIEIKLHGKSKAVAKSARQFKLPAGFAFMLVIREGQNPQVISESTEFKCDDRIIALAPTGRENELRDLLIGPPESD
ncbi:MAG TPA: portal protein [Dehalococcoidia bacterium]|nr:portal protein [Dehalococcoidia bacterium]